MPVHDSARVDAGTFHCFHVLWTADLGSKAYGGPVVADGKIFVGTNNQKPRDPKVVGDKGIVMCFEEKTGKFLWQAVFDKLEAGIVNDYKLMGICATPRVPAWNEPSGRAHRGMRATAPAYDRARQQPCPGGPTVDASSHSRHELQGRNGKSVPATVSHVPGQSQAVAPRG